MIAEVTSAEVRALVHRALGDPSRVAMVDVLTVSDRTPGELRDVISADWNLLAHHLRVLEAAGVVERHRSEGDARRRYVRLCAGALEGLTPPGSMAVAHPLFVCTHNSARSQFAAALWGRTTGARASSAGTEPADRVHPLAVRAARSYGIDLAGARPRGYGEVDDEPDVVVSVCDRALEARPPFDAPTLHWSVPDPSAKGAAAFTEAFADIAERVARLSRVAA